MPFGTARLLAQSGGDRFPELPPGVGLDTQSDYQIGTTLGRDRPEPIDFDVARALMERAPFDCPPIDVAQYWRNIGQGRIPDLGSSRLQQRAGPGFVRGWPRVYNPVIVQFFSRTSLDPTTQEGDGTAWCAAFVNWCIARGRAGTADLAGLPAGAKYGSGSASSGSFRCWGQAAEAPRRGDIVVWAVQGTVRGCALGQGHVGFYVGPEPDGRMTIVGGNQRDPATVRGATQSAVCQKPYGRSFNVARRGRPPIIKRLHSIRTAAFLR